MIWIRISDPRSVWIMVHQRNRWIHRCYQCTMIQTDLGPLILIKITPMERTLILRYKFTSPPPPPPPMWPFKWKLLSISLPMKIWKSIYLNCGERNKDMIDHRSYGHNLSSCEIKAWKRFRSERNTNPRPLRYRCTAPDRYRTGQRFESRSVLNFFGL